MGGEADDPRERASALWGSVPPMKQLPVGGGREESRGRDWAARDQGKVLEGVLEAEKPVLGPGRAMPLEFPSLPPLHCLPPLSTCSRRGFEARRAAGAAIEEEVMGSFMHHTRPRRFKRAGSV